MTILVVVALLACGAWGLNFWRGRQEAPVRQHIEAGRQAVERGQGGVAETEWRQATTLNPRSAEAWELLGDLYYASQDWGQAREAFGHLTEIAPETPRAWSRLAVSAARSGDDNVTTHAVDEALRRNPSDADALGLKSTLLAREKKWDEQLAVLRNLAKVQPENITVLARLADALTAQDKFDEARPLLDKILKTDANFAAGYAMRAEGAMGTSSTPAQLKQAESDLVKALAIDHSQIKARELLAEVSIRLGKTAQGVAHYEKLIEAHPYQTIYLNALANAYVKVGDNARAVALRRRIAFIATARDRRDALKSRVANDPQNYENNLALGLLLLRSPEPLDAAKYLEKAGSLRPRDPRTGAALRELELKYKAHLKAGFAAVRAGNIKQADYEISRAMLLRPRDPRTAQAVQIMMQAAQRKPQKTTIAKP